MSSDNYRCPMECPYQTDDGKLAAALSLASRITLPLVTCVIVGFYFNSITTKESRAINQQEAIVGLGALFFAYQPTLMSEVLRFAANKYLK